MGGYSAPSIGPPGLSVPSYSAILNYLIQGYLQIYGQNQYVASDSQPYQLLSLIALLANDCNQGLQLAYNQRSPATAVGSGLDGIVKMNGIARLPYTFSTAVLTVVGAAGTVINNGAAQDVNGYLWALPSQVTIPTGGSLLVAAVCTTPGAIAAEPGDIDIIATPVGGWASVTNGAAADAGLPVEADSALRARQANSVALPSETRLAGTIAAIEALPGVGRSAFYENPTAATSDGSTVYGYPAYAPLPSGLPAHSITCVVEGSTQSAIAQAIYNNRGIGPLTNGTTTVTVTDPNTNQTMNISFYEPTYYAIYVGIQAHGLAGFTTATLSSIQSAVVNYLNGLGIGDEITISALYAAAMSATPNLSNPQFSIKSITLGNTALAAFTATINANGTGYTLGDVLTVVEGGGASGGTFTVTQITGSGTVTGISPVATSGGSGYTVGTNYATTGGTGHGCYLNLTQVAPTGTTDLSLLFYQVAQTSANNVAVAAV